MEINYPEIGICGLSCRLCPYYQTSSPSRCGGCKSEARIKVGCPFITCALKRKGVEFCWDCSDNEDCPKWRNHRAAGKTADSFKCYQTLEEDIECIKSKGVRFFSEGQLIKERLLREMLKEFNEGRSKSYYCIAATVMQSRELQEALAQARESTCGLDKKGKSKALHRILDAIAESRNYNLKLRK
jgi:hypothetical protein